MGRARRARLATERRIRLPKEDYYELRTLIRDCEVVEFDALKAANEFKGRLGEAVARRNAKFEALAKTHDFDPQDAYRWEDASCELVAVSKAKPPADK